MAPEQVSGEVFNVACGGRSTILDVYQNICALLGVEVEPEFVQPRVGDVRHSNADIDKARRLLDLHPDYDLAQGLRLTIDWYQERLKG